MSLDMKNLPLCTEDRIDSEGVINNSSRDSLELVHLTCTNCLIFSYGAGTSLPLSSTSTKDFIE